MRKKMYKVLNKNLQIDTVLGMLITGLIFVIIGYQSVIFKLNSSMYIFIAVAIAVCILNVVIDYKKSQRKYALMDSFLFVGILIYFANVSESFNVMSVRSYYHRFFDLETQFMETFPGTMIDFSGFYYSRLTNTIIDITFRTGLVMTVYSFYGFFTRYDSRFKTVKGRRTISSVLSNNSTASTIFPTRGNDGIASRIVNQQGTNPRTDIDEILNEDYSRGKINDKKTKGSR